MSGSIVDTPPAPSGSIHGMVVDTEGDPLGGLEVFVDRTERVATTDADGRFSFSDLPIAHYRVVAIGPAGTPFVSGATITIGAPADITVVVDPVETMATAGTNGESAPLSPNLQALLAGGVPECRIMNPEVLSMVETRRSSVTHRNVAARSRVDIANNFAGYRVAAYVMDLDVYTQGNESSFRHDILMRFIPLDAAEHANSSAWAENRRRLYLGSFEHFLRSLAARNIRNDGYAMTQPFQSTHSGPGITGLQETVASWAMVRDDQVVMGRTGAYGFFLNVPGSTLRVSHRGASMSSDAARYVGGREVEDRPTSRVAVTQGAFPFTRDGLPADGSRLIMEGVWGAPRLCHQLPIDLFAPTQ